MTVIKKIVVHRHSDRAHASFAPSSAHRVVVCPGSYRLVESLDIKDEAGEDAAIGTVAHYVAEEAAIHDLRAREYVGQVHRMTVRGQPFEHVVDRTMADHVQGYLDWCEQQPGVKFPERRVDISAYTPIAGQFGTSDHACISRKKRMLTISDLKYGMIVVEAKRNEQLILYALGFYEEFKDDYEIDTVRMRIYQPRQSHISEWTISLKKLLEWGAYIKEQFETAYYDENAPFVYTKKGCLFCPAKGACRVYNEAVTEQAIAPFKRLKLRDEAGDTIKGSTRAAQSARKKLCSDEANLLSTEELVQVWQMKSTLESRMVAVIAELRSRAEKDPASREHVKLIEASTNRTWRDQRKAERYLAAVGVERNVMYKESFVSPAQAEALIKDTEDRKGLSKYWVSPPGAPTLALASDPRPSIDEANIDRAAALFKRRKPEDPETPSKTAKSRKPRTP